MTHLSRRDLLRWRDAPSEADRAAIVGHLAECDLCSGHYAELIRTRPLEQTTPTLHVPDFIAAGVSRSAFSWRRPSGAGLRWALAAAAIVIAVLSWQTIEALRLRAQLVQAEAARIAHERENVQASSEDRARIDRLNRELQEERDARVLLERELARQREPTRADGASSGSVVSLFLTLGRIRAGGETKTVTIPNETASVRLMLNLGEQRAYQSYQVAIMNADGARIWARSNVPAGGQLVMVTVPASALPEDDYEIDLRGLTRAGTLERVGDYYFRALKP